MTDSLKPGELICRNVESKQSTLNFYYHHGCILLTTPIHLLCTFLFLVTDRVSCIN